MYQSHIHGNEYEAVDSNMQVIRDLTVTPRGANPTVDKILDNEIVVVLMDQNPDGRVNGSRGNPTGLDPNRDYLVQSQPEQQIGVAWMHQWLPTGFIEGHGYYTPTLIDGCTIPHNPGIQDDTFMHWNVQRIEQNRADFAATRRERPRWRRSSRPSVTGTRTAAPPPTTTPYPPPPSPAPP